eukprot:3748075-Pleurochrysis_carterae.AAC.2
MISAGRGVFPEKYPRKPEVRIGDGLSTSARQDEGKRNSPSRSSMRVSHLARRRMTSLMAALKDAFDSCALLASLSAAFVVRRKRLV